MDKKICELFAGVGGFRLGFDRLQSGWKTEWFSQWEPGKTKQWAHDCYVYHFGDCTDLKGEYHTGEDISMMNKNNIPDHNLLVGGFPCLTGDTLVLTKDGYKQLASIKKGDYVLSHDGTFNEVTNFFDQGIKKTYILEGYGFENIHATGNHKFYVRKQSCTDGRTAFTHPEWKSVEQLLTEKIETIYFGTKLNENSIIPVCNIIDSNILNITDESIWYLAGRYFADRNSGLIDFINNNTNTIPDKTDTAITDFLKLFGAEAHSKTIPGFMCDMPVNQLKSFINGCIASDKSENGNIIKFESTLRECAYTISAVLEKIYQKPCQINMNSMDSYSKTVLYTVICALDDSHQQAFYENGYIWYPLHSITEYKDEHVYDMEVSNTHSFIANGAITHNCQDYSVAHSLSSSKGIEGKKGVLWWQIRDILIAKRPPFVMLENVDRLLKSPASQRGRDFGIILTSFAQLGYRVEWRVVNAAEYGAVQRRRRTFIFAYSKTTKYASTMDQLSPEEIISKDGFMAKAFPISECNDYAETSIKATDVSGLDRQKLLNEGTEESSSELLETSENFKFAFQSDGYMKDGFVTTATVTPVDIKPQTMSEIVQSNADESYYITMNDMPSWTYMKGAKKIPRKSKDGHEYVFSEGPIAFPDPLDRPARTMLTSEGTKNRSSHVIADPATGRLRILTPVETERIQGFDDEWTKISLIDGKETEMPARMRRFCMGNALVVPMITRMGKVLDDIIEKE